MQQETPPSALKYRITVGRPGSAQNPAGGAYSTPQMGGVKLHEWTMTERAVAETARTAFHKAALQMTCVFHVSIDGG